MFGELLFSFDSLKLGISYKVKRGAERFRTSVKIFPFISLPPIQSGNSALFRPFHGWRQR